MKKFSIKLFCVVFCALMLPAVSAAEPVLSAAQSTPAVSSSAASHASSPSLSSAEGEDARGNIFEASLSEILQMLQKGQITSEMLCEFYLERIDTFDTAGARLNSILSINTNALDQARVLDAERRSGTLRGPLHGVVLLVKDNINAAGFPTTLGKSALQNEVQHENAAAVQKLVDAGAIILGKTNMSTDDLATRYTVSQLLGETRNVYDVAFSAGGCSGGSAVAVSANFAAAALATDTNGSATYPAALNGTVALRPTHGLVDYTGCARVVRARDTVVPVTRSVSDAALMLDVLTGADGTYTAALQGDALKGKTVAVLRELSEYTYNSLNEFKGADSEISALFSAAVSDLERLGATVVTVSIPELFTYYNTCRESLSTADAAKARLLSTVQDVLSQNGADALLFPTYLSSPQKSGFTGSVHNAEGQPLLNCGAYLPSLIGMPAITLPMGNLKNGIAAGLELCALPGADADLLALAYSFEQGTAHRKVSALAPNLHEPIDLSALPQDTEMVPESESPPPQNASPKSHVVAVSVIITAILALCVWTMLLQHRGGRGLSRRF